MAGPQAAAQKQPTKTILVIEDNALNKQLLHDLLTAHGYAVIEATEGMEGLRLARACKPDLILLDIQLPDISGLEVAASLKRDVALRAVPVIAVTAFAMRGDEERIRDAGCDDYIAKPIWSRQLLQAIRRFLSAPSA